MFFRHASRLEEKNMNIKILENKLQTILENDNFKITKENIADKIEELFAQLDAIENSLQA